MHLAVAMLADAARVEGGKVYVHGGGWDAISGSTFPMTHPSLSVVLLLLLEWDEAFEEIPVEVSLLDEDNQSLDQVISTRVKVGHPPNSKRGMQIPVPQQCTFQFVTFERPGSYRFRISARDEEVGSVRFHVLQQR